MVRFSLLTGRTAVHRLSVPAFWLVFVGFNMTFFMMHLTGLRGMPRRIHTYSGDEGWNWLNLLSSVGGFVMTIGFGALRGCSDRFMGSFPCCCSRLSAVV